MAAHEVCNLFKILIYENGDRTAMENVGRTIKARIGVTIIISLSVIRKFATTLKNFVRTLVL